MKDINEQNVKRAYTPAEIQFFQTKGTDVIIVSDLRAPFYGEDDAFWYPTVDKLDDKNNI